MAAAWRWTPYGPLVDAEDQLETLHAAHAAGDATEALTGVCVRDDFIVPVGIMKPLMSYALLSYNLPCGWSDLVGHQGAEEALTF